jgi:hypothetical protein
MNITGWFERIRMALASARRDRNNYRALAHLDDHLLKDIGLYFDQGIVRPLYPEGTEANAFVLAEPLGYKEMWEEADTPLKVCPVCGAALA